MRWRLAEAMAWAWSLTDGTVSPRLGDSGQVAQGAAQANPALGGGP